MDSFDLRSQTCLVFTRYIHNFMEDYQKDKFLLVGKNKFAVYSLKHI